jgi:iron only hydrogenase large subunit-like protein/predicted DNA-binding ArsR family transcriptional regulator
MCNNGSGNAVEFNSDLCIGCGECIRACGHGARIRLDDFETFIQDVQSGIMIVAIVAPAIAASFNGEYLKINGLLKNLGIKAVFDVSFGAELTIKSYISYMRKAKPKITIAQPCPTLVSYIEMYRPELIKYLAPADSPMMHTMKMIRRFYPSYVNHKFAVISPCLSKRREFDEVGIGDYNVTFHSLEQYLEKIGKRIEEYPSVPYDNPPAERAVLFSAPGGLMRTVERYDSDITSHTRKIEGAPEVYHYLARLDNAIQKGKAPVYELVDCLNCTMGCNGGPGTTNHGKHIDEIEQAVEKRNKEMQKYYGTAEKSKFHTSMAKKKLDKIISAYWEEGLYTRSYVNRSDIFKKAVKVPEESDIERIHKQMHKKSKSDILDCGSCGYNSCEQMTVAVYNGLNKPENCRHFINIERHILGEQHKKELNSTINKVYDQAVDEMNKSFTGIETLTGHINETAEQVLMSSASITDIIENITSTLQTLEQNAETVEKLTKSSEEGRSRLAEISELAASVSLRSDMLIEASKIIGDISQETSILGMNAAIEAAHAGGAAGSGFAVVAGQIRNLADNSGKQAGEIGKILKDIKTLIDNSTRSSARAQEQFDIIMALVNTVQKEELHIKNAVETESTNGRDVIAVLNEVNTLISKIKSESSELLVSGQTVLNELKILKGSV